MVTLSRSGFLISNDNDKPMLVMMIMKKEGEEEKEQLPYRSSSVGEFELCALILQISVAAKQIWPKLGY